MLKKKPDVLSNDKFPKTNLYKAYFSLLFICSLLKLLQQALHRAGIGEIF